MRKEIDLYDEGLKQAILDLSYSTVMDSKGEFCDMIFLPESDYGFAEIYRMYDNILVFLIPTYGGVPDLEFHVARHSVDYLISKLQDIA